MIYILTRLFIMPKIFGKNVPTSRVNFEIAPWMDEVVSQIAAEIGVSSQDVYREFLDRCLFYAGVVREGGRIMGVTKDGVSQVIWDEKGQWVPRDEWLKGQFNK